MVMQHGVRKQHKKTLVNIGIKIEDPYWKGWHRPRAPAAADTICCHPVSFKVAAATIQPDEIVAGFGRPRPDCGQPGPGSARYEYECVLLLSKTGIVTLL